MNIHPSMRKRLATWLLLAFILYACFFILNSHWFSALLLWSMFYILIYEWPGLCIRWYYWFLTPVYIVMPFLTMVYMHEHTELKMWLILLIVSVCIFDTGAFITGKLWGRTKLAPSISPNKTYEGILGGFCLTLLSVMLVKKILPMFHSLALLRWTLYISFAATCGDLFESWLKRNARIKDSGSILPGHGGLLDRFDSILGAMGIGIALTILYNINQI